MIQTNLSKFDLKKKILRHIFVQITFETRKRNIGFYVLRQGVPEGRSSEGYASFKQRERDRDRQTDREKDSDSDCLFTKFYNKESVSKAVSIQT